jgi:D-galactosaminyltransferase
VSLDRSKSWTLIYDNGGARIYEWRPDAAAPQP